jgi:hypothetical protein
MRTFPGLSTYADRGVKRGLLSASTRCRREEDEMGRDIDESTRRRMAVAAGVDPRSIAKELRGLRVRGMAGHRARAVLVAEGLLPSTAGTATDTTLAAPRTLTP